MSGQFFEDLALSAPVRIISAAFLLLKYGWLDVELIQDFQGVTSDCRALGVGKNVVEDREATHEIADIGIRVDLKSLGPLEAFLRYVEMRHQPLNRRQQHSMFAIVANTQTAGQVAKLTQGIDELGV